MHVVVVSFGKVATMCQASDGSFFSVLVLPAILKTRGKDLRGEGKAHIGSDSGPIITVEESLKGSRTGCQYR